MDKILPSMLVARLQRYIINKLFGAFLETSKLNTPSGVGDVWMKDTVLDPEKINESLKQNQLPMEVFDGSIDELHIHIPWSNLKEESLFVKIDGLSLTIQARQLFN